MTDSVRLLATPVAYGESEYEVEETERNMT